MGKVLQRRDNLVGAEAARCCAEHDLVPEVLFATKDKLKKQIEEAQSVSQSVSLIKPEEKSPGATQEIRYEKT